MIITWIDKKSVLYSNKRRFKAGDIIPAGILSQNRIDSLLIDKKIKIDAEKKIEVKPEVKVIKTEKPVEKKKSKAQLDEEELQRLIDEESFDNSVKSDPVEPVMNDINDKDSF